MLYRDPKISVVLSAILLGLPLSLWTLAGGQVPEKKAGGSGQPEAEFLFAKEVLPLLQAKCLGCHGDDPQKIRGDLDMRNLAGLLKGGGRGAALIPGHPEKSLLIEMVFGKDKLVMPPKQENKLTLREIQSLQKWIAGGAPWPDEAKRKILLAQGWQGPAIKDGVTVKTSGGLTPEWTNRLYDKQDLWAFRPLKKVSVPWQSLAKDAPRHPIDAFIQQKLQAKQLQAAPLADRKTLIWRVTYDLLGLPPAPQEVESFLKDKSPDAYSSLVDRLLASKHYGERMAQHWLDVVRYADSDGFARDTYRDHAWKYRDYVIQSFNEDKAYDRFILEQIAGDELEPNNAAMQDAVSFLWMGPWEHTNMSEAAVTRQLWLDDVTNSVGVTFLGQGLACAKCHDHKFDPIPTRDYYGMQAVFASTLHHDKKKGYLVHAQKPQTIHILKGGSIESKGDEVTPGLLSAFPTSEKFSVPNQSEGRRLALAKWIADSNNPLTARVMVNRVWQMHFGKGLVATPNNFGKMGARPTHPELLDWLAQWFMDNGWSVKKLHRLILTSQTYQRSGQHPDLAKVQTADPKNELLAYFPPRRLTAEEIRDSMLAASGELNRQIGGPSIWPEIEWDVAFQPRLSMGKLMSPYEPSSLKKERNRRTLYVVRLRNLPNPFLEVFNQPGSEMSCEGRDESTIAPQAFSLFKSQFAHNRALAFAGRLMKSAKTLEGRIEIAFQLMYGRSPTNNQLDLCRKHVLKMTQRHQHYKPVPLTLPTSITLKNVKEETGQVEVLTFQLNRLKNYELDLMPWDADVETRALAELCLVLFNSSEFLYVY